MSKWDDWDTWDDFSRDFFGMPKKRVVEKEKPVDMESSGAQGDIDISSNFSKDKVIMVVGRKDYNWIATLSTVTAREYARQLIAAADALDNQPEAKEEVK